ncbi:MAG: hypothetical protein M1327_07225 [Candidatus Thermoplasmatota archaeon]|nr:hypothetical protein [Candidatus Thermoplasmatota archaeon]
MRSPIFRKGKDKSVGVVIGALLLTVLLFAFLSAYILYDVPSTERVNANSSITNRENSFIGLTQSIQSAPYQGSFVSHVIPLGYNGVPPFSQPTPSSISYENNTSLLSGYLNYSLNIGLANSSLGQTLSVNEIALLPISINLKYNEPSQFNVKLTIDSSAYAPYENPNLTNIFFTYSNGTVIPSWLENNASKTKSSSIYWLKLNGASGGTTITVDMVFLPLSINIMNKYQTGEAPQCSPIYGEYNNIANVLSPGLEYQIYYDSSGTVDSSNYQNNLYNANLASGTTITEGHKSLKSSTLPLNTSLVGVTCSVNGKNRNYVIINYGYGYHSGNTYPNPPVQSPTNSFLIKMIGFAELNTSSTIIYGGTDDGMAVGYTTYSGSINGVDWLGAASNPDNLFNGYTTQGFTIYYNYFNAINGTYPIEMDYFQDGGNAYTALWSSNPVIYYHPIFPSNGALPTITIGTVQLEKIANVPITIRNTQNQNEPSVYQQNITVQNSAYSQYESSSLENIIFTYQNGTIIPSWLQTGGSNTSSTSVYWLSLYGMPAYSYDNIQMIFLPKFLNMMNNFRTGENPSLSGTYGEYDDGSSVFVSYYSGSSIDNWDVAGSAAGITTAPTGSPAGGQAFYAASQDGDYLYTNANYAPSSSYIIQYYVYTTGLGDFFFSSDSSGHGQMSRLDSRVNCYDLGLASTNSWTNWNAPVGHQTLSSGHWYLFSIVIANGKIADYQNTNLMTYSNFGVNINPLSSSYTDSGGSESYNPLGSYIGLVGDALGPSYHTYWNGIIIRDYPANGVMPTVTFASVNTTLSNSSLLHLTGNYKIYGSLDSLLNLGNSNAGTIYLADGSTILSNSREQVISNNLPVNLSLSSNGISLSIGAVSIHGSNQTDSAIGSSIVKMQASDLVSFSYYDGEPLSLLSPAFVPYSADIASINLTSFSYTIAGSIAPGFNFSLYQQYGKEQSIGLNHRWSIGSNLYVISDNNTLRIGLINNYLLLESISIKYQGYYLISV